MEEKIIDHASKREAGAELRRDQRLAIFVDVQNMFYSAKNIYDKKLDFAHLLEYVSQGRPVIRAICYVVVAPDADQSSFIQLLEEMGYEVKVKQLIVRPDGTAKGDWDMGLAIDAITLADKVDTIALVSGDGDFEALVHLLKARGVRVEVYGFPSSTAESLRKAANSFYPLGADVLLVD